MSSENSTATTHHSRISMASTVILIIALLIAGYIAYQARPWEAPGSTGDGLGLTGAASDAPRPGNLAPDFTLQRADGSVLQLSDLRGQPVFLNFWATWCLFCTEEMPDMQRIADEYDDQLIVLGVNAGEAVSQGSAFANRIGVSYELVYDTEQEVVEGYRVRAMPTSYFIGPDGTIIDAHFVFLTYDDMQEKVAALLTSSG